MTQPQASPITPLQVVRAYLAAIERGADADALSAFYSTEIRQQEFPNRVSPSGAVRGAAELHAGRRKGQSVTQNERYVIHNVLVDGERVALELTWSAELKVPLGKLQVGDSMRSHCGMFFRVEGGRIAEHHTFDCFEPF